MEIDDLDLKLLAGMPVEIEGVGLLHIPTLRQVIDIGYSVYNKYISAIMFDKSNVEGITDEEICNFDLMFGISVHNENFRDVILESFNFFFKKEAQLYFDNTGAFFYLGEISNRIDNTNFQSIQEVIMKANHIKTNKEELEFNPGNEQAKALVEKIMAARKQKPKKKETMNLQSIVSGLAWRSNGINMLNVFDLTIYQLYDGFFRTERIDNYQFTLSGVYAGTVNGKEINFNNIHWTRIIEEE